MRPRLCLYFPGSLGEYFLHLIVVLVLNFRTKDPDEFVSVSQIRSLMKSE